MKIFQLFWALSIIGFFLVCGLGLVIQTIFELRIFLCFFLLLFRSVFFFYVLYFWSIVLLKVQGRGRIAAGFCLAPIVEGHFYFFTSSKKHISRFVFGCEMIK